MTTNTADTIVDTYLSAYGESDEIRRRELIAAAFVEEATLADPPVAASGHDGIDEMFAAVQAQFPRNAFRRTSIVDQHHDAARYEWELVAPTARSASRGPTSCASPPTGASQRSSVSSDRSPSGRPERQGHVEEM